MKTARLLLVSTLLGTPLAALAAGACVNCTCAAAPAAAETTPAPAPVGHPLRGVILEVLPEKSALLVRHEEIPGVMRAMTMLLKVDAAVLPKVKKNQVITATLTQRDGDWWLSNIQPVPPEA